MDDDDIQEYEASGWRKRHIGHDPINVRNATLEEVAQAVYNFKAFEKDTMDSFVVFIREMKHERFR
jgi:CHASE3 domain sensor protein